MQEVYLPFMLQLIRILSLIGLWLSGLSLYEYLSVKAGVAGLSVCKIGQSFDCATVSQSAWSIFFGFPLASWGIAYYIAIFLFGIVAIRSSLVSKETTSSVLLVLSFLASIFSIFLFCISYFSIGKLCPLCIGLYIVNFLMFAASVGYVRPLGFISGLVAGALNFIKLPSRLIGTGGCASDSALARLGVVVIALVVFGTTVAEDYISDKMVIPRVEVNKTIANWKAQPEDQIDVKLSSGSNGDFSFGNPHAQIEIVEFSDFECPACRHLYTLLKPILEEYKDKIHFIQKNYPLDNACNSSIPQKFHEYACYLANLTRCAGEQNKFWEMVDYINLHPALDRETNLKPNSTSNSVRTEIENGFGVLNLDQIALKECVSSERQYIKIKQDIAEGNKLKIDGTPKVWVNRKKFIFERLDDFRSLFESILASK